MSNTKLRLPNVRRLFIPDPGHVICDVDLAGADAQVVAWEADDEDLKEAFRSGLKVHHKNATDIWGDEYLKAEPYMQERIYKQTKVAVHGTNYGATAKTIAITQGWPMAKAEGFQRRWFDAHPGIRGWHTRIQRSLEQTKGVKNAFGYSIRYFDRIGSVFTEALAWVPQSTVALTCFRGAVAIRKLACVQLLLQVHDSLVFQLHRRDVRHLLEIEAALLNPIPYDDPLTIQWGLSISPKSWGDLEKVTWQEAADRRY